MAGGVANAEPADDLARGVLARDERAGARLMRAIDDGEPIAAAALGRLHAHTGRAYVVGVTGSPGAGKSTLVDALVAHARRRGDRVGVVAVDPTSPLSGGAILGDRVRMQRHAPDQGVFIRSLATRGSLGGLSRAAADVVDVLDAMGFDLVLLETVGVGQDEVDVTRLADLTLVVAVPGMGDGVQALKAGLLELADVLVVNKADRDGADALVRDLQTMLALREIGARDVPIVETVATADRGIDALVAAIDDRRRSPARDAERRTRRVARAEARIRALVEDRVRGDAERLIASAGGLASVAVEVAERRRDPRAVVDALWSAR